MALFVLGALGALISFIGLLFPIPKVLPTRRKAWLALRISLAAFIAGPLLGVYDDRSSGRSASPAKAADSAEVTAKKQQPAAPLPFSKRADAEATAFRTELSAAWKKTKAADHECAAAWSKTFDALQRADRYGSYDAATDGAVICRNASSIVEAIYPVKNRADDKAVEALEGAILDCKNAEAARGSALAQVAQTLDGDLRPSQVAEAREAAEMSAAGVMRCVLAFTGAATHAGIQLDTSAAK